MSIFTKALAASASVGSFTARSLGSGIKNIFKGKGAIRATASAAYGIGRFALRHPTGMVAGGLAGAAMYGLASSGSNSVSGKFFNSGPDFDSSLSLKGTGASSTGFAPGMGSSSRQEARQMYMDSTNGLVQGMHAGRH